MKEDLGHHAGDDKGKHLIDEEYKKKMPLIGSLNTIGNKASIQQDTESKNNSGPEASMFFEDKANKREQQFEISFADIQLQNSLSKDKSAMEKELAMKGMKLPKDQQNPKQTTDRPTSGLKKHEGEHLTSDLAAKHPPKPDRNASSPYKKSTFNVNNKSTRDDHSNANSKPSAGQRGPPPKAKKFYEKAEAEKITDLQTTSVFKNGIIGNGAGRSASTGDQKIKKKGYLRQMEEILEADKHQNLFKSDEMNREGSTTSPKIDLFFKRYAKLPTRQDKIDHNEIKAHSNQVKVAQLEAEKIREEKRKRFVGWIY